MNVSSTDLLQRKPDVVFVQTYCHADLEPMTGVRNAVGLDLSETQ